MTRRERVELTSKIPPSVIKMFSACKVASLLRSNDNIPPEVENDNIQCKQNILQAIRVEITHVYLSINDADAE